jgi:hypothetical protein
MKSTLPGVEQAQKLLEEKKIAPPAPAKKTNDIKEEKKIKTLCGVTTEFQVNTRKVELHPVMVRDWIEFSKNLFILENETLYEIFRYTDGPGFLWEVIKLVCRVEEVPELFKEMTQLDYLRFRNTVLEQNDLDFEEVFNRSRKKIEDLQSLRV